MYYRNAECAMVVYDVTKHSSFDKARFWVNELKAQAKPGIIIALIGNKLDLVEKHNLSEDLSEETEAVLQDIDSGTIDSEEITKPGKSISREVSSEEGQELASSEGLLFFEASAKSGHNVREIFMALAGKLPEDTSQQTHTIPTTVGVNTIGSGRLDLRAKPKPKGCQC